MRKPTLWFLNRSDTSYVFILLSLLEYSNAKNLATAVLVVHEWFQFILVIENAKYLYRLLNSLSFM